MLICYGMDLAQTSLSLNLKTTGKRVLLPVVLAVLLFGCFKASAQTLLKHHSLQFRNSYSYSMFALPGSPLVDHRFGSKSNLNFLNVEYAYSKVRNPGEEKIKRTHFSSGMEVLSARFWPVQLTRKPKNVPPEDNLYLRKAPILYDALWMDFRFWNIGRQLIGGKFIALFSSALVGPLKLGIGLSSERKYTIGQWEILSEISIVRTLDSKPVVANIGVWWNISGVDAEFYFRNKKYPSHSIVMAFEHYFLLKESSFMEIYKPYSFINKFEIGYQFSLNKLKVREAKVAN